MCRCHGPPGIDTHRLRNASHRFIDSACRDRRDSNACTAQIFASEPDCEYTLYTAEGTWRKKDDRHLPASKHSCSARVKWRRRPSSAHARHTCATLEGDAQLHALWLVLVRGRVHF
jgi:hypothetical protein